MRPLIIVFVILLLALAGGYFYFDTVIKRQPSEIASLQTQIDEKNKQLLAAQILGEKREAVTKLIQNNLVDNQGDSLAEKSSIPFLRYLTSTMDRFNIRLVSLTPLDVISPNDPMAPVQQEYIEVPYEMKMIASYKEFGEFLDALEKSPHLIKVNSFEVTSDLDQSSYAEEIVGRPRQHPVQLHISTLAILKASSRSESGKYY